MENEPYDYRRYDQIWQRVAPQEDPYPDVRAAGSAAPPMNGGAENYDARALLREDSYPGVRAARSAAPPMNAGAENYDARALLREELRHMTEVLRLLEKALA